MPTFATDELREMRLSMLNSIGRMNIAATSGGRVEWLGDMLLRLPIRYGYAVEVELDFGSDTYTVRRTFTRSGTRKVFGEETYVYFDTLGETVYRAGCYVNVAFGGDDPANRR